MTYINKKRRLLSLLLGLFFLFFTGLITFVGTQTLNVDNYINQIKEYEEERLDEQLQDLIIQQYTILDTIEAYWRKYNSEIQRNINTTEFIKNFITDVIVQQTKISETSIICVSDTKDILYIGYNKSENKKLENFIKNKFEDLYEDNINIVVDDIIVNSNKKYASVPFGTSNRSYFLKKSLYIDNRNKFYIIIGFDEQIVFNNIHHPMNNELLEAIQKELTTTQVVLSIWMIFCIIFAIVIIIYMYFFEEKNFNIKTGLKSKDFIEYCKLLDSYNEGGDK